MDKVLIAYATTTGNTQKVAELIHTQLSASVNNVELKNMADIKAIDLNDYSWIILGSSTMEAGSLNIFSEDFFADLEATEIDLSGKKINIFGLGDKMYPDFCGACEIMQAAVVNKKGTVSGEVLKIDGKPNANTKDIVASWVDKIQA